MYDEFICEACPLLIGDGRHDRAELMKARRYWELQGNEEKVKEYNEILRRY